MTESWTNGKYPGFYSNVVPRLFPVNLAPRWAGTSICNSEFEIEGCAFADRLFDGWFGVRLGRTPPASQSEDLCRTNRRLSDKGTPRSRQATGTAPAFAEDNSSPEKASPKRKITGGFSAAILRGCSGIKKRGCRPCKAIILFGNLLLWCSCTPGFNITEIAEAAGFVSPSHFTRMLKTRGAHPSNWRKTQGGENSIW